MGERATDDKASAGRFRWLAVLLPVALLAAGLALVASDSTPSAEAHPSAHPEAGVSAGQSQARWLGRLPQRLPGASHPEADSEAMHRAVLRHDPGTNLCSGGTAGQLRRNRMRASADADARADAEAHGYADVNSHPEAGPENPKR
ncbi:MAG: hypothetical protein OXG30_16270 [bacterium]|nr:hypothetical protein [bacterium]